METIGTENAFEVSARARALAATGKDVVFLQIGEPDFDTPANVREAAKAAIDAGMTHYPPYAGLPDLRAAIADDTTARRGFQAKPENTFVTVGGKGVMVYAIMALVDPGDEVIVPDPGYPIYDSITRFVGGISVPIPIRQENDFRLDVDELASLITPKTKVIVINSPANPTGGVLTREDNERIAELALQHDLVVLSDEIYSRILYDGAEHVSIASLPGMQERTIVLDGFSKTYAMTGWRLGYAIVPDWLVQSFGQLIINTISGVTAFAQAGAIEALRGPQAEIEAMVREFDARRNLVVDGLNEIPGFRCARPQGAFYVFPDVSETGLTGQRLADRLLYEAGVCVLAGTAFGGVGTNHIRISYANSQDNLREALSRIRTFVASGAAASEAPAGARRSRGSSSPATSPTRACARSSKPATPQNGTTSCHRRARSCFGRSKAATGCWRS
jgi:aspartate/methionine/tyrosine aminotransferase